MDRAGRVAPRCRGSAVRRQVSYTWGRLAGAAQRRGRSRPVNDMWIAAVGITNGLPLATRNVKDYADFVEHHGLQLFTN